MYLIFTLKYKKFIKKTWRFFRVNPTVWTVYFFLKNGHPTLIYYTYIILLTLNYFNRNKCKSVLSVSIDNVK